MKIIKKVNNNVAIGLDKLDQEVVILGKGVGFRSMPYELDDDSDQIEKIFKEFEPSQFNLLKDVDPRVVSLSEKIIDEGLKTLEFEASARMLITLADHINYAIERKRDNQQIKFLLSWELKNIYPEEFEVGMKALSMIKEELDTQLPNSEAMFIALHFIDARIGSDNLQSSHETLSIIHDIMAIIRYSFNVDFDESSLNFNRFVTHFKFFLEKKASEIRLSDNNEQLYQHVQTQYKEEAECAELIAKYLMDNHKIECSQDERLYLIIHIRRLTQRAN